MDRIKLYQLPPLADQESASPFCVKVHYALRYKHLPFEIRNVLAPAQVWWLNPARKVPVVTIDGTVVSDSSRIIRFLETRYPAPPLYPKDEQALASALKLEEWASESLYWHVLYERWLVTEQLEAVAAQILRGVPGLLRPAAKLIALRQVRRSLREQGHERLMLNDERVKLAQALESLENLLITTFLVGTVVTIADIAVAAQVAALDIPATPFAASEIRKRAKLKSWLERVKAAMA